MTSRHPLKAATTRAKPGLYYQRRAEYERSMIRDALAAHPTHTAAAKTLGLPRTYLLRLMRQLGIAGRTR